MSDTTLFNQRVKGASKQTAPEGDEVEYVGCSFGRIGTRPQVSVTFRTVTGAGFNFAYAHYYGTRDTHPNGGFVVEFSRHRVRIEGRNLERLHRLICDHKVREIIEIDELHAEMVSKGEPVVTRLHVEEKKPSEET